MSRAVHLVLGTKTLRRAPIALKAVQRSRLRFPSIRRKAHCVPARPRPRLLTVALVAMRESRILILGLLLTTAADGRGCCTREFIPAQGSQGPGQNPTGATKGQGLGLATSTSDGTTRTTAATSNTWSTRSGISSTSVSTQKPEPGPKQPRCIAGSRRNCAETPAGAAIEFPSTPPVGNCRLGEQECTMMGKWGPCEGAIPPRDKDSCNVAGDDSDCDGSPNKGCECVPAKQSERPCGSQIGECKVGRQRCENGSWGECIGDEGPQAEACDGRSRDRDCDGKVDLRDDSCECLTTDRAQLCEIPNKLGDCRLGIKRCENGRWSNCRPRFFRGDEACGARAPDPWGPATGDEDCDGQVDEAAPVYAKGCRYFILDADQDGFGAKGPSTLEDPNNPTFGCFCATPPAKWKFVEASGFDKVDADCGECDVEVPDIAYPSRKTTGSECLRKVNWPGGEFDYNCNGYIDLRYKGHAINSRCELQFDGTCELKQSGKGFWYTPPGQEKKIPQCGEHGLGGLHCEIGENENGSTTCNLAWHDVEQFCR